MASDTQNPSSEEQDRMDAELAAAEADKEYAAGSERITAYAAFLESVANLLAPPEVLGIEPIEFDTVTRNQIDVTVFSVMRDVHRLSQMASHAVAKKHTPDDSCD